MTYNRHTGQLEVLWEHHTERGDYPPSTTTKAAQEAQNDSVAFHVER